jgi:multidrug transporter EmrE-like cation transporter
MKFVSTLSLMIAGVALTMAGDVFLKRSNGWISLGNLGIGLVFYLLGCLPVAFLFTRMQFGTVFIAWEAVTIVLAMTVGYLVFGEAITQNKVVALLLVLVAIALTSR